MALNEILKDGTSIAVPAPAPDPVQFSFFVPCYNEQANVAAVIDKLATATSMMGASYEILVFDDCSADRTVEVVKALQQTRPDVPLRLFVNTVNRGVARNFIEGGFQARGTYYRVVMGDDVESVQTHLSILGLAGKSDIVIPYHERIIGRPLFRRLVSRFYTQLVNLASNRHLRYYNGSPLFTRQDVMRFHVEATGLGFQAEFLLRLLQEGRTFIEVPIIGNDREGSTSLNLRNFVSVGYSLFKILMRRVSGKTR